MTTWAQKKEIDALPKPQCRFGYPMEQVENILGNVRFAYFTAWFVGQTGALCEARLWSYEDNEWKPTECEKAHGMVVYSHDLKRFLSGQGPLD